MSTNRVVTITVYDGGDFGYDHALLGVNAGDVITWQAGGSTGSFGIKFLTPDTPLTTGGLSPPSGSPGNPIVGTVKNGLSTGDVYHYSVWATHLPDNTAYNDSNCPELIVR